MTEGLILHTLFQTLIGQTTYDKKNAFKKLVLNTAHRNISDDGYSNELTGHLTLHHEKEYEEFFKFVSEKVNEYLKSLSVDPEKYNINIIKTWFNITKESNNPRHSHADAHLSFSYYVNTPEDCKKMICFFANQKGHNNLHPGFLEYQVLNYNFLNSLSWSFETNEGDLFVFPASLEHSVIDSKDNIKNEELTKKQESPTTSKTILKNKRLVIAGDILLTFKEKTAVHMGIQPIKNWRTF